MKTEKFGKKLSYNNTFKRIEKKYLLTKEQKNRLINELKDNLIKDKFFATNICNIYFDDDNSSLIVTSMEKPIFKEKVRLRSYEVPNMNSDVFLEIKTKYKSVVGKRRIKMTLKEFYDFLENNEYDHNNQILKELAYCFDYYNLKPSIFIGYYRESYIIKNDEYLRVTFDSKLTSRRDDLRLEKGNHGKRYFEDEELYIMEIKTLGSLPLWLTSILSKNKIYPASFSKYGSIYSKEFINKEGGIEC